MKNILINAIALFTLLLMVNCSKDDYSFGELAAPSNLQVEYEIIGKTVATPDGDGTGKVKFTIKADNAVSYKFVFSDGTSENAPGGVYEKRFTKTGVNSYTVVVVASGKAGLTSNTTVDVKVLSTFSDDEAVTLLSGGTSKKWYFSASEVGHLGVGPNNSNADQNYYGFYYQAVAFEKAGAASTSCLYDNVLTFSEVGGQLKFNLDNGGTTFFNKAFLSVAGGSGSDDSCLNYATTGIKSVSLSPSESFVTKNPNAATQTRGTLMTISDGGFMGYYIGQSTYEILALTENRMVVRAVQGNDSGLVWYHTFTTTKPVQAAPDADYTNLVFSDEFNTDGAPDVSKWSYDLGAGGWGNDEKQTYTNAADNIIVAGGSLKITAKKVGTGYTSSRLTSQDKYEFKYGKIEVRAKLPSGGGTWPAIWMLGADIDTNAWPACGEIDIMEYKGNEPYSVYGTFHYPGRSGGNADGNKVPISNASTEFHVYKAIWSATSIKILVDETVVHSIVNNNTIPFNKDFFLLFNVAMGGTFGGAIDPAFTQSSMEIDYVRIYQ
ncbi:glycosyl hydrolase family 16 [Flavobacterium limicola]|uniref:Glycosyl hydrolase family 16 n=1 Tax=Flavobacterium limicola TaxID=180441 RepID=A0A495S783_9FLAO|nr:glycoside hydrolase family 16 protein [Flavobacterium limicola]RKS95715.1 glycosyl hydrolase family 16 [Flavobacterium limicola]